jgi:hypothetical protein
VLCCERMTSKFVQSVGRSDIHDGTIVAFEDRGEQARVTIKSYEGRQFSLEFSGVAAIDAHRPIDVLLYALSELEASPPLHRFAFVLWDEECDARLTIDATGFKVVPVGGSNV